MAVAGCSSGTATNSATPTIPISATPVILPSPTAYPTYAVSAGTAIPSKALALLVNGRPVYMSEYQHLRDEWMQQYYDQTHVDPLSSKAKTDLLAETQHIRDYLIYREILLTYAQQHKIGMSNIDLKNAYTDAGGQKLFEANLKAKRMTMADFRVQITLQNVALALVTFRPYYADEVHVTHISVGTKAVAESVRTQLLAGKTFATLAPKYSTDQSSKLRGGDLGYFPRGTYPPAFEAVAFTLPLKTISSVLRIPGLVQGTGSAAKKGPDSYDVLEVLDRRKHAKLIGDAIRRAQQQYFHDWYQHQLATAHIVDNIKLG